MISDRLPYDEQDALETILRFHGADDPALVNRLATLINWVHEFERAKLDRSRRPPFLISLLGMMGIWGKDALKPNPNREKSDA